MNRRQKKEMEIMRSMEEAMNSEDKLEELISIDLDEPDEEEQCFDFDDEISEADLLDAKIEAKGLNPRCMEDVEKYFKMKEGEKK